MARCVPLVLLAGLLALTACGTGTPAADGRVSLGLADTALAGGAPRLALQVSEAVLSQHPRDVPALLRQGDAYYALGEPTSAQASYRRALAIQPGSVPALIGLGRVALATDPAAAARRFDQALALDPASRVARTDRGVALDLMGQHGAAQTEYRTVIAQGGDVAATEVDLGLSLAMSGDADEAVRILQPIAARPDASARVRQDLAVALVLDGRVADAERLLLTQMSPEQARAAIRLYGSLRDRPLSPVLLDGAS